MKILTDEFEAEADVVSWDDFYAEEERLFRKAQTPEEYCELMAQHEQEHILIKLKEGGE